MKEFLILATEKILFPDSIGIAEWKGATTVRRIETAAMEGRSLLIVPKQSEDAVLAIGDLGVEAQVDQAFSPFQDEIKLTLRLCSFCKVETLDGYGRVSNGTGECFELPACDEELRKAYEKRASQYYYSYCRAIGEENPMPIEGRLFEVANGVISLLPDDESKYAYFQAQTYEDKALALIHLFNAHIEVSRVDQAVSEKVRRAIDDNQREFYVREQIKALNEELDGGEEESDVYLDKIEALNASDDIKDKLKREVRRLQKLTPSSPDAAILCNYLDAALELPWGVYTEDNVDLTEARKILDEDHYGLEKIKERLIEALAVRQLAKEGRSPILCLVGPPGIGKTSIAQSVARAMNRKFVRVSFGGVHDEAEIRGHRKTYIGAMPGRIITGIKTAGSMNPIFLMDEIDKMASDYRGDPASALLEVLDPEQNVRFRDNYMEFPFDLSKVLFITTANSLDTVARPLLDRMEIIEMTGYTEEEKLQIAKRYLLPKAAKQCGVKDEWYRVSDAAIKEIILSYTRESGVRKLEQQINAVLRKVACAFVTQPDHAKIRITEGNLHKFLGKPITTRESLPAEDQIGSVTGLAWTALGGETLEVETLLSKGKGELFLTGNLGDVMKESARIAMSYCHKKAQEYGMEEVKSYDVHIHVPEGATPKDGPSAGVTMATALMSAYTGKKADCRAAMTGELTLSGRVLPIGGLKEKSLAALRAGVKRVYIPDRNRKDYDELPESVKKGMEFCFVSHVEEIWKGVLR